MNKANPFSTESYTHLGYSKNIVLTFKYLSHITSLPPIAAFTEKQQVDKTHFLISFTLSSTCNPKYGKLV